MECKYIFAGEKALKSLGINRYIMECKCTTINRVSIFIYELIDTLWNVNSKVFDEQVGQNIELIDTLWNVN